MILLGGNVFSTSLSDRSLKLFASSGKVEVQSEIALCSLLDLVFVLLGIYFMQSSIFSDTLIVAEPKGGTACLSALVRVSGL